MLKKIIGVICTLAILAVIVFALMGAGTYRTMLPDSLYQAIGLSPRGEAIESVVGE